MKLDIKGYIVPNEDKAVYRFFGYDAVCPRDVENAIREADGEQLDVEINSPGGDVFSGSEIYTALRGYKNGLDIRIVGVAASAAGIIAMSGPCRMSPTALFMMHNVQGGARGDHRSMEHTGGVLQTADRAIANAYIAKSGMSESEVLQMMERETWLTAQQAAEKKLVDGVLFEDIRLVAAGMPLLSREVIEKTRSMLAAKESQKYYAQLALIKLGGIRQ